MHARRARAICLQPHQSGSVTCVDVELRAFDLRWRRTRFFGVLPALLCDQPLAQMLQDCAGASASDWTCTRACNQTLKRYTRPSVPSCRS